MNKRDAINEVLLNLNELPLDVADAVADIQIAIIAEQWLDISVRRILKQGWNFNTLTMKLNPNTDGYISIPRTHLSVDSVKGDIVVRDWKLFDRDTLSFVFTEGVICEVISDITFDDIPYHVADLIVETASLKAYINVIGNSGDVAIRREDVNTAKVSALREEANSIDGNMLEHEDISTILDRTSK